MLLLLALVDLVYFARQPDSSLVDILDPALR